MIIVSNQQFSAEIESENLSELISNLGSIGSII